MVPRDFFSPKSVVPAGGLPREYEVGKERSLEVDQTVDEVPLPPVERRPLRLTLPAGRLGRPPVKGLPDPEGNVGTGTVESTVAPVADGGRDSGLGHPSGSGRPGGAWVHETQCQGQGRGGEDRRGNTEESERGDERVEMEVGVAGLRHRGPGSSRPPP